MYISRIEEAHPMPETARDGELLQDVKALFANYKQLGDKALAQISGNDIHWKPEPESNSIATIVMHMSGNLLSRWTDYLTTDGEKPWRKRDEEFEEPSLDTRELLARWEKGWACVMEAMGSMNADTLGRTITIRGEKYTVLRALNRSLTHAAYHVGQIVFVAKALRSGAWNSISVPKGKSQEFNASMGMKNPPRP
jgi:hypothetical protein